MSARGGPLSRYRRRRDSWAARTPTLETAYLVDGVPLSIAVSTACDPGLLKNLGELLAGHPRTNLEGADGVIVRPGMAGGFDVIERSSGAVTHLARETVLLHHLEGWLSDRSLDLGEPSEVRIHAAAVCVQGRWWIVTGHSQSGKSTLTLDAVARKGGYITDERVRLGSSPGGVLATGLRRPIHLRDGAALEHYERHCEDSGLLDVDFRKLVPIRAIEAAGGEVEMGSVVPSSLLILTDDEPVLMADGRVSPGWAVLQLAERSMDLVRAEVAGLTAIADLCLQADIHVAAPRSLSSITALTTSVEPVGGVAAQVSRTESVAGTPWEIEAGTTAVGLADEVIVWTAPPASRLVHLLGEGGEWWQTLASGGLPPHHAGFADSMIAAGAISERTAR